MTEPDTIFKIIWTVTALLFIWGGYIYMTAKTQKQVALARILWITAFALFIIMLGHDLL